MKKVTQHSHFQKQQLTKNLSNNNTMKTNHLFLLILLFAMFLDACKHTAEVLPEQPVDTIHNPTDTTTHPPLVLPINFPLDTCFTMPTSNGNLGEAPQCQVPDSFCSVLCYNPHNSSEVLCIKGYQVYSNNPTSSFWVYNTITGRKRCIMAKIEEDPKRRTLRYPHWSKSGYIYFNDLPNNIWSMKEDGSDCKQLTFNHSFARLRFNYDDSGLEAEFDGILYQLDLNGNILRTDTLPANLTIGAYSFDGTKRLVTKKDTLGYITLSDGKFTMIDPKKGR
jgi:hypothetical protein